MVLKMFFFYFLIDVYSNKIILLKILIECDINRNYLNRNVCKKKNYLKTIFFN